MAQNVGADFGSLGFRAAYFAEGDIVALPSELVKPPDGGWLLWEPSRSNGSSIAFPAMKTRLGAGPTSVAGGISLPIEKQIVESFAGIVAGVSSKVGGAVGQVVITVPARYTASRRTTLCDAAVRAGFAEAHLLNDSMAAVIAHTHQSDRAATVLVLSMGYSGFEIGLIRAAKGHYRALGYEGGESPGGAVLDGMILSSWLRSLSDHRIELDIRNWGPTEWLRLQRAAQWVKESLSTSGEVDFPLEVLPSGAGGPMKASFSQSNYNGAIADRLQAVFDLAEKLMADSNLTCADLDEVILVGGMTQIPTLVGEVKQRLGRVPIQFGPGMLARGAALYAERLGTSMRAVSSAINEKVDVGSATLELAGESSLHAALVTSNSASPASTLEEPLALAPVHGVLPAIIRSSDTLGEAADAPVAETDSPLHAAHRLISQQKFENARQYLVSLIREAQAILESLPPPTLQPVRIRREAAKSLATANKLLGEGRREEAVQYSHAAWQAQQDSPEVFEQMIEVHRQAAMSVIDPGGYADSIRWLKCACQHDQSNTAIHEALAERHFLHAKQLVDAGRIAEVREALEQCLYWKPDHKQGRDLQDSLLRR